MNNAPAHEFGLTCLPLSTALATAKRLAVRIRCLARACIAAAAGVCRECALRRIEPRLAVADSSFSRLGRDVMRIEARRLL